VEFAARFLIETLLPAAIFLAELLSSHVFEAQAIIYDLKTQLDNTIGDLELDSSKRLEVEVRVFSMEFWGKGFTIDNVSFMPLENHYDIERRIEQERKHYQTGVAKVTLPTQLGCNKAIKRAREILSDYSMLLSFAHGHHVFFHEYSCYEVENEVRKSRGRTIHAKWLGKPVGGPNMLSPGFEAFLRNSIPLVHDKTLVEKTGIARAIQWYNEAMSLDVLEVKFPALWIGLETLASAHARSQKREPLLSADEMEMLRDKFHDLVKFDLKIEPPERRDKLYRNLEGLQREPIKEKVSYILQQYGFEQYKSEIEISYDLRNDLVHGMSLDSIVERFKNPFEIERKLERILEKLILSILNFYENEFVHSAIQRDNLLARG
jgi:hypothetical protein